MKIDDPRDSLEIYLQQYADFLKEVNEDNGLELATVFNNLEEGNFHGIYTYPKELYTKDLSIGMKAVMKQNGIHPYPFKFMCGIQQCTSQFANKMSISIMLNLFTKPNILI
jgi:hypothetical protein